MALARALAVEPRVLLLDEPLSALDAATPRATGGGPARILRTAGTTTVLVTHDHEEAFAVADPMAVMRDGRIVQQGPIDEVWRRPVDARHRALPGLRATVLRRQARQRSPRAAGLPERAVGRAPPLGADAGRRTGALTGIVESARATPEQLRLVVEVDGARDGRRRRLDWVATSARGTGCGSAVDPSPAGHRSRTE